MPAVQRAFHSFWSEAYWGIAPSGKDLMQIVSDARESWNERLPGWPSFPIANTNASLTNLHQGLWNQLAPERPVLLNKGQIQGRSRDFWDQLFLVGNSTTSQYDILRNFFSRHPDQSDRLACLAVSGDNFHGQHHRPWQAVAGNLHLSVSVPLDLPSGPCSLAWTMLPAVAVMHTLNQLKITDDAEDGDCGIKWVNDVLWGGRKLAGVISSVVSENGRLRRGFLGIGLNVAIAPQLPEGEISQAVTCLHQQLLPNHTQLGSILELVLLSLAELISHFESNSQEISAVGSPDYFFQEYRRFSLVVGRQVRILTDPLNGPETEICQGKVLNINPDLSLVVEGYPHPVSEGRLYFQE